MSEKDATAQLGWINYYIVSEDFGTKQLAALVTIVGLINNCQESEDEILEFADKIRKKYSS